MPPVTIVDSGLCPVLTPFSPCRSMLTRTLRAATVKQRVPHATAAILHCMHAPALTKERLA